MIAGLLLAASLCDLPAKIQELQSRPAPVVEVGAKTYPVRTVRRGKKITVREPERTFALALVDPVTCDDRVVTVIRRGEALFMPSGVALEPVTRSGGLRWNGYGTWYAVNEPAGMRVLGIWWPYRQDNKSKVLFYVPFSEALLDGDFVGRAQEYIADLATYGYERLAELAVASRIFPDRRVVDVDLFTPDMLMWLAPIEHMDPDEFRKDPCTTTNRVLALIGANGEMFASAVRNSKKATGPYQFTPGTYRLMVRNFPTAHLNPDPSEGSRNHKNVVVAAKLLHDADLAQLRVLLGDALFKRLTSDVRLTQEAVLAAYNAGAGQSARALKAYFANGATGDWIRYLLPRDRTRETELYIKKWRYVSTQWSPVCEP